MLIKRFSNLDGLRFFAALIVLLTHIEVFKLFFGLPPLSFRIFSVSSHLAVTFFFVLSGFLITHYLLLEKNITGKIVAGSFYKRRIARIWPLYYLLLILNFFVLNHMPVFQSPDTLFHTNDPLFNEKVISCMLFLPNYAELKFGNLMYMKISWTLAVEEFFYLFLPVAIYFSSKKNLKYILIILLILFLGISFFIPFLSPEGENNNKAIFQFYNSRYRLYAFVAGALAAYYYIFEKEKLYFLNNRMLSWLLLFLFFVLIITGITFWHFNHQAYSLFFAILIFSLCYSEISPWLLNNRFVVYLGKISYGIYMFHPIVIVFIMRIGRNFFLTQSVTSILLLYILVVVITILVATLSYELFEKRFLTFRRNSSGFPGH